MILKAAGTPMQRHATPCLVATLRQQTATPPRCNFEEPHNAERLQLHATIGVVEQLQSLWGPLTLTFHRAWWLALGGGWAAC